MTAEAGQAGSPPRLLGPWVTTALVFGNLVGSGVLLLPASLAPLGWNALTGWAAVIVGGLALAHVFARLAAKLPASGGPYAYTREAFGRTPAYFVAWAYWANLWIGNAAVAVAPVAYLGRFVPTLAADPAISASATVVCVWAATLLNLRGSLVTGRLILWTTVLKLAPLVIACVGAAILLARGHPTSAAAAAPISFSGTAAAATLAFWAVLGLESATVPAGKVRDPARTVPLATLAGTLCAALIAAAVTLAVQFLLPAGEAARSPAPFATFAETFAGPWAGGAVAVVGAVGAFGALIGWILLQGELPAAMARDGVFPRPLSRLDARGTPVTAHIVASTMLSAVVALSGTSGATDLFNFLAQVAVLASLVAYLACTAAAVRLRALTGPGLISAVLATAFAIWALAGAERRALLWFAGLLVAGWPVLILTRARGRGRATSPAVAAGPAAPRG